MTEFDDYRGGTDDTGSCLFGLALLLIFFFAAVFFLAGCATGQTDQYRDIQGGRTMADLDHDAAVCRYEFQKMAATAPYRPIPGANPVLSAAMQGPGAGVYYSCMEAKGWKWVGVE